MTSTTLLGMPVRVSEHATTTKVAFSLVANLQRRRKRYTVRRDEWKEPAAYFINGKSLSMPGFPVRDTLVIHPELYAKLEGAQS